MAVGCPVVVSNVTSLPEVCGSAALYCDPHDPASISSSIRRILDNPHLRRDLQAAGKEHARKFTWTSTANELLAIVQR
jgi:glycosyltransferase involved in cell wall biosynthesis